MSFYEGSFVVAEFTLHSVKGRWLESQVFYRATL